MNVLTKLQQEIKAEEAKGNVINVRRLANYAGKLWSESLQ